MIQLTFVSNFFNKQHYSMVWQYIFKHKFITDIRFNNKQNHEDNDFSKIAITLNKNDIPLLKVPSYFYNYGRPDSQTMKLKKPEISVVETSASILSTSSVFVMLSRRFSFIRPLCAL